MVPTTAEVEVPGWSLKAVMANQMMAAVVRVLAVATAHGLLARLP